MEKFPNIAQEFNPMHELAFLLPYFPEFNGLIEIIDNLDPIDITATKQNMT